MITLDELQHLKFDYDMNLLQLVCHEEAITILSYLKELVDM
jgi:hypothetical protein